MQCSENSLKRRRNLRTSRQLESIGKQMTFDVDTEVNKIAKNRRQQRKILKYHKNAACVEEMMFSSWGLQNAFGYGGIQTLNKMFNKCHFFPRILHNHQRVN